MWMQSQNYDTKYNVYDSEPEPRDDGDFDDEFGNGNRFAH